MKIDVYRRKCRKCNITLSEFEATEKNSLCIDCYKEENQTVKIELDKPLRLRNKKLYTA